MKRRITIWAAFGFFVELVWVLVSYEASPRSFLAAQHQPIVSALSWATCPVPTALSHHQLFFGWALLLNTATYAVVGLAVETIRFRLHPRPVA